MISGSTDSRKTLNLCGKIKKNPRLLINLGFNILAGEEGFEPSAYGFGDRRSTN